MKDRQIQPASSQASIPIISPVLHWLAMPAIVFLRSSFGYSFLRPKSVFLVFAWASLLFFIYAWMEPGAWARNWAVAMFALGASVLYGVHLTIAVYRETRQNAKHDFYSGTSHLLRLPGFPQLGSNTGFVTVLHLWLEPFFILIAATALRGFMGERRLSFWLLLVAAALWFKELLNYWYSLRSEKKHGDIIEDAEEKMAGSGGGAAPNTVPSAAGRKARVQRPSAQAIEEARYAEILRLMPPITLEQAEINYRALMKQYHPDTGVTPDSGKAAELAEAVEYFRRTLS